MKGNKLIITISGTPGSGKSTVGWVVADRLGLRYYSMGEIRRQYAREHGLTLEELNIQAEGDAASDRLVDEYQKKLAREENILVDSRLGYHFIPKSIKILLTVPVEVGARRIWKELAGSPEKRNEANINSAEELVESLKARIDCDKRRYRQLYGIDDPFNEANFDLVINTSDKTAEQVADEVVRFVKEGSQGHE